MQYYVLLCFDSIKQVDEMQNNLETRFGLTHNIFPHLTLTVFDSHENKDNKNVQRFSEIIPFRVVLKPVGIGYFKAEESTVFIEIEKTPDLMKLFNKYRSKIIDADHLENYDEDKFTPHISLATHLNNEQLDEALEIAKELNIPKSITTEYVALFNEQYQQIISKKIRK